MSLLKTVCFCLCPYASGACVCVCACVFVCAACVRALVRGQLLFTGAGKTIMEKYLWSTSVAHQQMIIKPGMLLQSPGDHRAAVRFSSRSRSLHTLYYITITFVNVCVCVWVCVCDCVCVYGARRTHCSNKREHGRRIRLPVSCALISEKKKCRGRRGGRAKRHDVIILYVIASFF
jgi:hypothetical protein